MFTNNKTFLVSSYKSDPDLKASKLKKNDLKIVCISLDELEKNCFRLIFF